MIRRLAISIAAATLWFSLAPLQVARAEDTTTMDAFLNNLKRMHIQAMRFCDKNRNIMSASDLAHANPKNDVFELLCMRALKGRTLPDSNWKFFHEGERIEGGTSDYLALVNGFNANGKLFYLAIGHRKIKRFLDQPNAQVFYQPRVTLYRFTKGEMQHVFEFVDPQTVNWNSPKPEKPDFSVASNELSVPIDLIWTNIINQQFGEAISTIPLTQ